MVVAGLGLAFGFLVIGSLLRLIARIDSPSASRRQQQGMPFPRLGIALVGIGSGIASVTLLLLAVRALR